MVVERIDKEVLGHILRTSSSFHPEKFAGVLLADGDEITEVSVLSEAFSSERSIMMELKMKPLSSNVCGSVHNHPASRARPSRADLSFFERVGDVNIIALPPYTENSWKAYNRRGQEINLNIVQTERRKSVLRELKKDQLKKSS